MQDKMWELQQKMDGKLDQVILDVGMMRDKLHSKGGLCDQVMKNTKDIAIHGEYISNRQANARFVKRMVAATTTIVGAIIAILKFAIGVI